MNELGVFLLCPRQSVILRAICDMPDRVCRGISPIIIPPHRRRLVLLLCQDPPDGCHTPRRLSARPAGFVPFVGGSSHERRLRWCPASPCERMLRNRFIIYKPPFMFWVSRRCYYFCSSSLSAVKKRSSPRHQPVPKPIRGTTPPPLEHVVVMTGLQKIQNLTPGGSF